MPAFKASCCALCRQPDAALSSETAASCSFLQRPAWPRCPLLSGPAVLFVSMSWQCCVYCAYCCGHTLTLGDSTNFPHTHPQTSASRQLEVGAPMAYGGHAPRQLAPEP